MTDPSAPFPTLLDAAAALRVGRVSAAELTERALRRIAELDPSLHAFVTVTAATARGQAAAADVELRSGCDRGPLHGIPVGLKDLIAVRGLPMAAGMPIRADAISTSDATVVRRLRDAGAVIAGTLQMTEGAYFEHHPDVTVPRNPWGPETLWPGASSSGPAVAVAAGLVYASVGSDTGGSIRFPAAANRVVGLKPTRGRISTDGTFHAADSLDHLGVFTRSVRDAAVALSALAGPDPGDPESLTAAVPDHLAELQAVDLTGLRVGLDPACTAGTDAATRSAIDRTAARLRRGGATLVELDLPDTTEVREAWATICSVEAAANHRTTYPARADSYGPLAGFLEAGRAVTGLELVEALRVRREFTRRLESVFERVGVLLTPNQPAARVTIADKDALIADPAALGEFVRFATPLNMSGNPTLTVPTGDDGAPVQLIAAHLAESVLLAAGSAIAPVGS